MTTLCLVLAAVGFSHYRLVVDQVHGDRPLAIRQVQLLSPRERALATVRTDGNGARFDFAAPVEARYYQWRTPKEGYPANQAGAPRSWRFEASADGSNWTLLDAHVDYDALTNRDFRIGPFGCPAPKASAYEEVDPFIGAGSSRIRESGWYGYTHPGARVPFGTTQVVADSPRRDSSCYEYPVPQTEGFACMRCEGVGFFGEFGNFLVRPAVDWRNPFREQVISSYSHASEIAEPGYYSVVLDRFRFRVETTATRRGAMMRFNFPETEKADVSIDLARRIGPKSRIVQYGRQSFRKVNPTRLEGVIRCLCQDGGWGRGVGGCDYDLYYVCEFSRPLTDYLVFDAEKLLGRRDFYEGSNVVFSARFACDGKTPVEMRMAFAFTDLDGARRNFAADFPGPFAFDKTRADAKAAWEKALAVVDLEGGTPDERETFMSCLFFTMHDPRDVSDADGRYPVYCYPKGKKILSSDTLRFRTVFSGWDVFRSWSPLMALLQPKVLSDTINSLMQTMDVGTRYALPVWDIFNCRSNCMCGNPAISLMAEAWADGIRTFDAEKALALSEKSFRHPGQGIPACGYLADDMSRTLENAYTYWCASRLAAAAQDREAEARLASGAQCYTNLWCKEVDWMRSRSKDGGWREWKGLTTWWQGTMESNPYQQGWFVPQDPEGFARLCGGAESAAARLEKFLELTPRTYFENLYYSHANEPVHLVPFMFHHFGRPDLTSKWVRSIATEAYDIGSRGLVGPEDEGQMCAWYCLAALGLHPACPGAGVWMLTAPLFDKMAIHLDPDYFKGGTFTIVAKNNAPRNVYIAEAKLNGRPLDRLWLTSSEITSGGTLELTLAPEAPKRAWRRPPNPLK